jgi:predicted deacylase
MSNRLSSLLFLILHFAFEASAVTMQRSTVQIPLLPSNSIGVSHCIKYYKYSTESASSHCKRVYIQASLHADELPGMLVATHLVHLLGERVDEQYTALSS